MSRVSARDLRNHTRAVLERVEGGEEVEITVNGQPVAELSPARRRQRWVPRAVMEEVLREHPADPGLLDDIAFMRDQRIEIPDD